MNATPMNNLCFLQEIKETGTLSSRVLTVYWNSWGPALGFVLLLSLFLMQASKNLSDAWLANWISTMNTSNSTRTQQSISHESKSYTDNIADYLACIFRNFFTFRTIDVCTMEFKSLNSTEEQFGASQNSFYLAIYISIAIFNSIIALIRAFTFAYAGIKAAKSIHTRLLNSVIFVRFINSTFDIVFH